MRNNEVGHRAADFARSLASRASGQLLHTDAAQFAGKLPLNVDESWASIC